MARVITVTSGKGGVGKSTTSASFSMGLAQSGYKTLVIDFDIGLRNLDLLLGHEKRVLYDIVNVMRGQATLDQALVQDYRNGLLFMLPGSQTESKDVLNLDKIAEMMSHAKEQFDYIICDSPAGIEYGAEMSMYFADDAILVATPEIPSVRDTDRMLGLINEKSHRAKMGLTPVTTHLIVNRYNEASAAKGHAMSTQSITETLGIQLLGVIPEDSQHVTRAANRGEPVILDKSSLAGKAYMECVSSYLDGEMPQDFGEKRKGFIGNFLSRFKK